MQLNYVLDMTTKYTYACEPLMFHENGLMIGGRGMPTAANIMGKAIKSFTNNLLKRVLLEANPIGHHKCNSFCRQEVQFLIGYPHSCDLKSSVPTDMHQAVENFEQMIRKKVYHDEREVEIQSIAIRLLPCSRYLEIIETAYYL